MPIPNETGTGKSPKAAGWKARPTEACAQQVVHASVLGCLRPSCNSLGVQHGAGARPALFQTMAASKWAVAPAPRAQRSRNQGGGVWSWIFCPALSISSPAPWTVWHPTAPKSVTAANSNRNIRLIIVFPSCWFFFESQVSVDSETNMLYPAKSCHGASPSAKSKELLPSHLPGTALGETSSTSPQS